MINDLYLDKYFNSVKSGIYRVEYQTFSKSNIDRQVIDELHSDYISLNFNDRIVAKRLKSMSTYRVFFY